MIARRQPFLSYIGKMNNPQSIQSVGGNIDNLPHFQSSSDGIRRCNGGHDLSNHIFALVVSEIFQFAILAVDEIVCSEIGYAAYKCHTVLVIFLECAGYFIDVFSFDER